MDKSTFSGMMSKFSFAQMTSNSDGKTSGSGTMGIFTMAAGLVGFLAGAAEYFVHTQSEIMTQSIVVLTIGAGLLGYRKSKDKGVQIDPDAADDNKAAPVGAEPDQKLNS